MIVVFLLKRKSLEPTIAKGNRNMSEMICVRRQERWRNEEAGSQNPRCLSAEILTSDQASREPSKDAVLLSFL